MAELLTDEEIASRRGCYTCGCRLWVEAGPCEGEIHRAEVRRLRGTEEAINDGRLMELTAEVVRLAMAVDPEGFIGVRVRELAALWRLRSDEWLEKAAEALSHLIVLSGGDGPGGARGAWASEALDLLRKHRDGKA